ncbi:hypothetical protein KP509_13G048800 [Ceratopteris richardii]|uniref:Uncharacterized protein n=1 Tax=Ceratopteris richardii TaxID=49495 RepID=A0A8T2TDD7_CERRI|nr:hypothetical protein KP509_13G048800 [Ceratopteris richardii]
MKISARLKKLTRWRVRALNFWSIKEVTTPRNASKWEVKSSCLCCFKISTKKFWKCRYEEKEETIKEFLEHPIEGVHMEESCEDSHGYFQPHGGAKDQGGDIDNGLKAMSRGKEQGRDHVKEEDELGELIIAYSIKDEEENEDQVERSQRTAALTQRKTFVEEEDELGELIAAYSTKDKERNNIEVEDEEKEGQRTTVSRQKSAHEEVEEATLKDGPAKGESARSLKKKEATNESKERSYIVSWNDLNLKENTERKEAAMEDKKKVREDQEREKEKIQKKTMGRENMVRDLMHHENNFLFVFQTGFEDEDPMTSKGEHAQLSYQRMKQRKALNEPMKDYNQASEEEEGLEMARGHPFFYFYLMKAWRETLVALQIAFDEDPSKDLQRTPTRRSLMKISSQWKSNFFKGRRQALHRQIRMQRPPWKFPQTLLAMVASFEENFICHIPWTTH